MIVIVLLLLETHELYRKLKPVQTAQVSYFVHFTHFIPLRGHSLTFPNYSAYLSRVFYLALAYLRPAIRDWACQTERCHTLSNKTSLQ